MVAVGQERVDRELQDALLIPGELEHDAWFSRKTNISVCRRLLKNVVDKISSSGWFDAAVDEDEYPGELLVLCRRRPQRNQAGRCAGFSAKNAATLLIFKMRLHGALANGVPRFFFEILRVWSRCGAASGVSCPQLSVLAAGQSLR